MSSPIRRSKSRGIAGSLALLGVLAATLVAAGPAAGTRELPDLDDVDPVRFSYEGAVVESAQVETRTGTPIGSADGVPSNTRIWVDVIRPDTTEPVPTILIASPYYNTLGRGWKGEFKTPTTDGQLLVATGSPQTPFPEWYDEYFVPRGYAVALMDLRGTRNSEGCQVYGDRDEVFDTVDVIDWIAEQPWSNGKVGMTGGSYDGTIAIGAAAEAPLSAEHPDALSAIIPIRAIDRWYDYHFFNGVQSFGHALTPALFTAVLAGEDNPTQAPEDDLLVPLNVIERKACIATLGAATTAGYASPYQDATSDFWSERDFLKDASGMRAATFLIAGLFDFNVKNHNTGYLWSALPDGLPKKLWFANMDHADPHQPAPDSTEHVVPYPFQDRFVEWTHRWFAAHLKGLDTGTDRVEPVEVQRRDGRWDAAASYPASSRDVVWSLRDNGTTGPGIPQPGAISWTDQLWGPTSARLVSAPLAEDLHLSGQIGFDLTLAAEGVDTTIGVEVAALPPGVSDDVPASDHYSLADAPLIVTYGWLRAWYRDDVPLRGPATPTLGAPLVPGTPTEVEFGATHTDVVVPKGWRLRFTFSNAAGGTVPAGTGGAITVDTASSRIVLPVAG